MRYGKWRHGYIEDNTTGGFDPGGAGRYPRPLPCVAPLDCGVCRVWVVCRVMFDDDQLLLQRGKMMEMNALSMQALVLTKAGMAAGEPEGGSGSTSAGLREASPLLLLRT